MHTNSALRTLLLTLLCVTLLAVRVGGAHLHFCFDGKEPSASLHMLDVDTHPDAGMSSPHRDYDVMLSDQSLAKSGKPGFELPVFLIAAIALIFLAPLRRRVPIRSAAAAPAHAVFFLRPPTRGPPRLISL